MNDRELNQHAGEAIKALRGSDYKALVVSYNVGQSLAEIIEKLLARSAPQREARETYTEICMNEKCPRGGMPVEVVRALPPSPEDRTETEEQIEERMAREEAADNLRLLDYIAHKIGLPINLEMTRENFDAWFNAEDRTEGREVREALAPILDAIAGVPAGYVDGRPFASVPNDARAPGTVRTITWGQIRTLISALSPPGRDAVGEDCAVSESSLGWDCVPCNRRWSYRPTLCPKSRALAALPRKEG